MQKSSTTFAAGGSLVAKSCPTLCDPMDCSPGFSVHRISQARILEWVANAFSKPPLDCSVKGAIYIIKVSYSRAADLLTEVLTLISHWMLATRGRGTILEEAADCRWDNPSRVTTEGCWPTALLGAGTLSLHQKGIWEMHPRA